MFKDTTKRNQDEPAPEPGARILCSRYEILNEIGHGAMGTVFHARDQISGSEVALKCLIDLLDWPNQVIRSLRENFQLIEKLHHPNIVGIKTLDHSLEDGSLVLVMEYVRGQNLEQHRQKHGGTLAPEQVVLILNQIAQALDYGHSMGVLHRDIKPSNIMITPTGVVKVADYGIAAPLHDAYSRVQETGSYTGPPSGTRSYMSPEQWMGHPQDGRSDQFSLAVTIWEFLTGAPPFQGETPSAVREKVLSGVAPPLPGFPASVRDVLVRAFSLEPGDRYPSCNDFAKAFAQVLQSPAPVQATARGKSRKMWRAFALTSLLALVALGVHYYRKNQTEDTTSNSRILQEQPSVFAGLRYHALVIGINDYSEGWQDLNSARPDAEAVADVLEQDYGFSVTRLMDGQATREGMIRALDQIASLGSQDAILVYYAGHGTFDDRLNEGFFIPSDGRPGREGQSASDSWVWNNTITKIFNTSRARHILLIADACYSGSLFRGDSSPPSSGREMQWYKLALEKPSRYLITSGDVEPVQDQGGHHSVFAQQVLHYLQNPGQEMFSASDMGQAIRSRVAELTGQHFRMGALAIPADGGGEFVFVPVKSQSRAAAVLAQVDTTGAIPGFTGNSRADRIQDVIDLQHSGATNSARRTASLILASNPGRDPMQAVLAASLNVDRNTERQDRILQLLSLLQHNDRHQTNAVPDAMARPRIVAVLGPHSLQHPDLSRQITLNLQQHLARVPGLILVDRATLADILQEIQLQNANLTDPRLQDLIGRLLPASLLITGDVSASQDRMQVNLRLLDTATSRILLAESTHLSDDRELSDQLATPVQAILDTLEATQPLTAGVLEKLDDQVFRVGMGQFQNVKSSMRLEVFQEQASNPVLAETPTLLGTGTWVTVRADDSLVRVHWHEQSTAPADLTSLKFRAVPGTD